MNDIKSMNVSTVIDSISKGEIKVKDIASVYNKTDRTIQKHIKTLGYVWDAKARKYLATGEGYNKDNDTKLFTEIVEPNPLNTTVEKNKSRSNSTNKSTNKVEVSSFDSIDLILKGTNINNSRVQRAYYLDNDIATIIDSVDNKQKSNLVNECLRKVFKEKGLL